MRQKAGIDRNAVHEASRRSEAEGLDHSGTLEAEKRHALWGGWHRSVSGVSFRREVLTRMSQDKPHLRATTRLGGVSLLLLSLLKICRSSVQKINSSSLLHISCLHDSVINCACLREGRSIPKGKQTVNEDGVSTRVVIVINGDCFLFLLATSLLTISRSAFYWNKLLLLLCFNY